MGKCEEYREGEERCRRLAQNVSDPKLREQLLFMADKYASRAEAMGGKGATRDSE